MNDTKNLLLAVAISFAVLFGFQYWYGPTKEPSGSEPKAVSSAVESGDTHDSSLNGSATAPSPRIAIETPRLKGSLRLRGAIFDDMILNDYRVDIAHNSEPVRLLSAAATEKPYDIAKIWRRAGASATQSPIDASDLPDTNTLWTHVSGETLTPTTPVVLRWESPHKLVFERHIHIDDNYLVRVTDRITNRSGAAIELVSHTTITRQGEPETSGFFILHEGPVGVFNNRLFETKYSDLAQGKASSERSVGGWAGFTDKYWLTAIIPASEAPVTFVSRGAEVGQPPQYTVSMISAPHILNEGVTIETTDRLFIGAKELERLDAYSRNEKIARFDLAVDFGWFYFLTKPIFYALEFFHEALGNFGLSILLLTVCIKLLLFPLANKSYRSMAKMRRLQPELMRLKETYADDRMKQHTEMMNLYKKFQVNPLAGCLPIIIQIPVFFALYKVLFISIEMRHAPFYGWIQDLSAPDPTTLFNLFGFIPWTPPSLLMVGAWPIIMGLTMFLQQKLSPQPADPIQARVFLVMPVIFTFFLSQFAVGLVIYWAWNNVLSVAQQWAIMRADDHRTSSPGGAGPTMITTSKARREAKRAKNQNERG